MSNKTEEIVWKDIQVGDLFPDGSQVISIHESYEDDSYQIAFKKFPFSDKTCIVSSKHAILCDTSKCSAKAKEEIERLFGNIGIPTKVDRHIYFHAEALESDNIPEDGLINPSDILFQEDEIINSDPAKVGKNLYWLPAEYVFELSTMNRETLYCNSRKIEVSFKGSLEVFCVETDTHQFETVGLIHHNSVTLRTIIFHCLTHSDQIALALIDVKFTEFTPFKGFKNIVAVANEIPECVEVMRIARECMYARNQEMAKHGIQDMVNFKPKHFVGEVSVAGHRYKIDQELEIRLPSGEVKTVTVEELENYLD